MGLGSRTVCDADAGGTDASYRRRGKRIEQATNSAGLRSLGLGCCAGGEAKARTHKLGRPGPPWSYPLRPAPGSPSPDWVGAEEDPGLVPECSALCLPQPAECAARPAGAQPRSALSSQPRPPRGRQGPGAKGRRPASASGPRLCGNPTGAAATAAWRREEARTVREKFVGPEPSAPPPPLKPAPLKQAGDEA